MTIIAINYTRDDQDHWCTIHWNQHQWYSRTTQFWNANLPIVYSCPIAMVVCIPPRYRAGAAIGLAVMERVMLSDQRVLNERDWRQFEESYLLYRSASMKLGELSIQMGRCRWRQRPKSHALEHGVYDFNHKNLRFLSNYLDEDFVRRSKYLAIKATPKFVSKHVLFCYSVAATLRWTGSLWGENADYDTIRWPGLVSSIPNNRRTQRLVDIRCHRSFTFGILFNVCYQGLIMKSHLVPMT